MADGPCPRWMRSDKLEHVSVLGLAGARKDVEVAPTHETDVLIIGAGPAGLFGAYYAGFRGMSVTLVDSLPEIGGQVSALYPEKAILDVAGFVSVKGRELVEQLVEQAASAKPKYHLGRTASSLVCDDES